MKKFLPKPPDDDDEDEDEIPLTKTRAELEQIVAMLELIEERHRYRAFDFFKPYPKQEAFFDLGAGKRERLLMAGNQLGKTEAGAYEAACHLTGDYPDWWLGRRFDHAVKSWGCGEDTTVVRDVLQAKLCGEPGIDIAFGSGMIPKDSFHDKPTLARGIADAFDTIQVKHVSGGVSTLKFKSYEQGRKKFQAATLDFIWCDEEPAMDIYSECITRITATGGMMYTTFTPLHGLTELVDRFSVTTEDRESITMTMQDAAHMTPEKIRAALAGYPEYERDARANGVPLLGSGRVFNVSEASITEPPLKYVPEEWFLGWGIDFGIGHPFAAALMLWDKDNDIIHVHHAFKIADQLPLQHAAAMKPIGINVPVSWPHDGNDRDKGSGEPLAKTYKNQGLRMQPTHATFESGGYSTEAGVQEMQARMVTGRLKVAAHLSNWLEEFRFYHRKDGVIVKTKDDILSATRIGIIDRRHWKQVKLGGSLARPKGDRQDIGLDIDPFTGQ